MGESMIVCVKRQLPICVKRQSPVLIWQGWVSTINILHSVWKGSLCEKAYLGDGLTINIERIDSQHFTVHVNCRLVIIDPVGQELWSPTISMRSTGLRLVPLNFRKSNKQVCIKLWRNNSLQCEVLCEHFWVNVSFTSAGPYLQFYKNSASRWGKQTPIRGGLYCSTQPLMRFGDVNRNIS